MILPITFAEESSSSTGLGFERDMMDYTRNRTELKGNALYKRGFFKEN